MSLLRCSNIYFHGGDRLPGGLALLNRQNRSLSMNRQRRLSEH